MKRILVVLSVFVLAIAARANTIVFDTLGPSGTYNADLGYAVGFQQGGIGPYETAAQFTALTSGKLAHVDLGLTFVSGAGSAGVANAFLYSDANGLPDNANQIFLGSVIPSADFGTTNNILVSFKVSGNVSVTMGSLYWLVLKPEDPSEPDSWNLSSSSSGTIDQSTDDSTWFAQHGANDFLPAFRISTAVTDSGGTFILMLASVALLVGHRAFSQRMNLNR